MIKLTNPTLEACIDALKRPELAKADLSKLVEDVFEKVALEGDVALRHFTEKFDQFSLTSIEVNIDELNEANEELDESLKEAIKQAYTNIYSFHVQQKEAIVEIETMPGVTCWRKSVPIERVGLYIPGGSAPLFSTILMLGIPAQIAGCPERILCTPCDKTGKIHPAILYSAQLVGISKIYKLGGIQAIAAMTLGTETVPAVYKLFGPGNQYVTAAKLYAQKFKISIDMPAGPSEVMVISDETAIPAFAASDLLAQAEHGADSQVVFITDSTAFYEQMHAELEYQLDQLPRKKEATESLKHSVGIIIDKHFWPTLINSYAPEHLILQCSNVDELVEKVINAGSVFIGNYTPESAGDYASGTNHTLPTNGYAKQYSGVSLDSFVKKITYQRISKDGIQTLGPIVEKMAVAEGLFAHKNAVSIRINNLKNGN